MWKPMTRTYVYLWCQNSNNFFPVILFHNSLILDCVYDVWIIKLPMKFSSFYQLIYIYGEFTEYFAKLKGSITETNVEDIGVTSEY
jgi:hypothetical protein